MSLPSIESAGFMERNGVKFAGLHIIIDLYGASNLDSEVIMRNVMLECIETCNATLLSDNIHSFEPTNGVTGVACLAESHISVHTWPEYNFASFDIFMCGESQPELAADIIKERFSAEECDIRFLQRGTKLFDKFFKDTSSVE